MGKFDCLPFLYAAVTKLGDVVQWKVLRPVDCRLPASRRLFLLLTLLTSEKASNGFNPTSCYASADFDAVTLILVALVILLHCVGLIYFVTQVR